MKQSREQLRQATRMEAVGKLAGGISHEFNNLLQIILGYSQILKEGESSRFACDIADTIYKTSLNARELTRQLLLFSRKEGVEKKVLSVSELMRDLLPMLERLLEENITLESDISLKDDRIYGDARQLEQVLINLSVNARDAMSKGGILRISTGNHVLPDKIEGLEGPIPKGDFVVISVSDTGDGIDPEILPEIFDPFFTTKEKVKGTGLDCLLYTESSNSMRGISVFIQNPPGGPVSISIFPVFTIIYIKKGMQGRLILKEAVRGRSVL